MKTKSKLKDKLIDLMTQKNNWHIKLSEAKQEKDYARENSITQILIDLVGQITAIEWALTN